MPAKTFSVNRLKVPEELEGCRHFLYKTTPVEFDKGEQDYVVNATKIRYANYYKNTGDVPIIQAYRPASYPELQGFNPKRIERILAKWKKQLASPVDAEVDDFGIVVCPVVTLHDDYGWAKRAFHSVVIHTGPYPYVIQTAHVERKVAARYSHALTGVVDTRRCLEVGDAFIFDPTTAHMAVPQRMHQDQLLILVQHNLKDTNSRERRAIVKHFPQARDDAMYTE